jgi:hypothetical protein
MISLVIQVPRNQAHKTRGRTLKMGRLRLSQHVARKDPELAQLRGVEAANPLPKGEVGERSL